MIDILFISGIVTPEALEEDEYFNPYVYSIPIASLYEHFKNKMSTKIFIPDVIKRGYLEKIPESKIYAITFTYPEFIEVCKIVKYIRNKYPEAKIVIGGQYATTFDKKTIDTTECDYVIRGDGINAMEAIISNTELPLNVTTSYKSGDFILNHYDLPVSMILDKEAYYGLDWNKIYNNVKYDGHYKWVITAKGCYYNCSFCTNNSASGGRIIYRDDDLIIKDLIKTLEHDPEAQIFLSEPLASGRGQHRKYLSNLMDRIYNETPITKENKLGLFTRFADFTEDFAEIFEKRRDKLSVNLMIGLDNFNDKILDDMNKKTNKKEMLEKFELIKNYKSMSNVVANIIFGTPGYSKDVFEENIEETYKVYKSYDGSDTRIRLSANPLWLLPGSTYYSKRYQHPDIFITDEDIYKQIRYTILDNKIQLVIGLQHEWFVQAKRDSNQFIKEISRLRGNT